MMDSAPSRAVVKKILPHWTEAQVDYFLGNLWDYGFEIAPHASEQMRERTSFEISGHQDPDHPDHHKHHKHEHKHKHEHHHAPPQKKPGDI
jgi:hypothetical protein